MFRKNSSQILLFILIALFITGLFFFYFEYVPLIPKFQIALIPSLLLILIMTFISFEIGTLCFIFVMPLINNLPYFFGINENIPHAPSALVLCLFYFLGFLLHATFFKHKFSFNHKLFQPLAFFSLLILFSTIVTFSRYTNFFPFLSDSIYELTTNVNGVSAGGAITSIVFSSLNYITGFLFFFLMLNFLLTKNAIKKIIVVLGASALLSMIFGMYQSLYNQNIGKNLQNIELNLVNGTFKDSLSLGAFLALMIPFFLGAIFSFRGIVRMICFACLFLAIALIFHTGSKIGLVSSIVSLFLFFFFYFRFSRDLKRKRNGRVNRTKILGLVILAIIVTSILFTIIQSSRHEMNSISRIKDMFERGILDSISYYRGPKWESALSMLKDYPFTGVGVGAYIVELPNYLALIRNTQDSHTDSAENYFLQVGSELGFIGLIVMVFVFGVIGLSMVKRLLSKSSSGRHPYLAIGIALGIGSYFFHLLFHTYIGSFEIKYIFWLFVAMGFSLYEDNSEQTKDKLECKFPWPLGLLVIVIFAGLHLWNSSHSLSLQQRTDTFELKHNFGFYETETHPSGFEFNWTKRQAGRSITIEKPILIIPLHASNLDIAENPVHVKIYFFKEFFKKKMFLGEVVLTSNGWQTVKFDLSEYLHRSGLLYIEVSRTWNPQETLGTPDSRTLGAALGEIGFEEIEYRFPK